MPGVTEGQAVEKLEKLFAAVVLVVMAGFWMMMSPAAITSRDGNASPMDEEAALLHRLETDRNLSDAQRAAYVRQVEKRQIERLKRRDTDTPNSMDVVEMKPLGDNIPAFDPEVRLPMWGEESQQPVFY